MRLFILLLSIVSVSIGYAQTIMFDDFNYVNSSDADLLTFKKWEVVDGINGPPYNGVYDKDNITFINDPLNQTNKLINIVTTVNGVTKSTTHARLETSGYDYFEGTYVARVKFSDVPYTYSDANIQTFYTIVSMLLGEDGSKYSELDFEYMASDKWETSVNKQVMYLTAWNRYVADPWAAWKNYFTSAKSWDNGWHTCIVSCTDGTHVKFWIDDQYFGAMSVTDNDGTSVYPRSPMQVAFANWIWNNQIGSSTAQRNSAMQVDWCLFYKDEELTKTQVDNLVDAYRTKGVIRRNLTGQEESITTNVVALVDELQFTRMHNVIYFSTTIENVNLFDVCGNVCMQQQSAQRLDLSGLAKGVYVMQTTKGNCKVVVQ